MKLSLKFKIPFPFTWKSKLMQAEIDCSAKLEEQVEEYQQKVLELTNKLVAVDEEFSKWKNMKLDSRIHSRLCPANHLNLQRVPDGECNCGAISVDDLLKELEILRESLSIASEAWCNHVSNPTSVSFVDLGKQVNICMECGLVRSIEIGNTTLTKQSF